MCDLEPFSEIWSHINITQWYFIKIMALHGFIGYLHICICITTATGILFYTR